MQKFTKLTGRAAPLPIVNIDTDMIIPKQFLKTIKRTGLGKNLFDEMRYTIDGNEISDFVLNQAPYRSAQIIIALDNFGCGSSREHAPWAILDFGIRSVIAPSFADIFYNNCFKNGILPVQLSEAEVREILVVAQNPQNSITVDLEGQKVEAGGKTYSFKVDEFRKHCLINGLDDIGLTLLKSDKINNFEEASKQNQTWLWQA
jgi:3-isopropylmalate/(R)-2-methylmalate dehydratase small subunit